MSKGGYIGVSGKARKITKGYIGVNGIARKLKKGYIGVNGIARVTWGGNVWKKYSCEVTQTQQDYYETPNGVGNTTSVKVGVPNKQEDTVYTGYTFNSKSGYSGTGATRVYISGQAGYYKVNSYSVVRYTSVDYLYTEGMYEYYQQNGTVVASCSGGGTTTYYDKGETFYGEITVDDDVLPEQGTLLSGSIEGSYCVIKVNGTTYYYEKA